MTEQTEQQTRRDQETRRPDDGEPVLTPTEARQGQIILGRRARMVWLAVFVIFIAAVLLYGVVTMA